MFNIYNVDMKVTNFLTAENMFIRYSKTLSTFHLKLFPLEKHCRRISLQTVAVGMAQWVKTVPRSLSSTSRTHTVEGENQLLRLVLWPPHVYHGSKCTHTHKFQKCDKTFNKLKWDMELRKDNLKTIKPQLNSLPLILLFSWKLCKCYKYMLMFAWPCSGGR